jgi:hypothetical protein
LSVSPLQASGSDALSSIWLDGRIDRTRSLHCHCRTVSISFSSPMSATLMIRHSRSIEILGWAWSQREGKFMEYSPKSRSWLQGFHACLPDPASASLPLWEFYESALSISAKVFVSFV